MKRLLILLFSIVAIGVTSQAQGLVKVQNEYPTICVEQVNQNVINTAETFEFAFEQVKCHYIGNDYKPISKVNFNNISNAEFVSEYAEFINRYRELPNINAEYAEFINRYRELPNINKTLTNAPNIYNSKYHRC